MIGWINDVRLNEHSRNSTSASFRANKLAVCLAPSHFSGSFGRRVGVRSHDISTWADLVWFMRRSIQNAKAISAAARGVYRKSDWFGVHVSLYRCDCLEVSTKSSQLSDLTLIHSSSAASRGRPTAFATPWVRQRLPSSSEGPAGVYAGSTVERNSDGLDLNDTSWWNGCSPGWQFGFCRRLILSCIALPPAPPPPHVRRIQLEHVQKPPRSKSPLPWDRPTLHSRKVMLLRLMGCGSILRRGSGVPKTLQQAKSQNRESWTGYWGG